MFSVLAIAPALFVGPLQTLTSATGQPLEPPSAQYWFGTDELGRDLLNMTVHGARISMTIGLMATLVTIIIGSLVGIVAGFAGGTVDNLLMRLSDFFLVLPTIVLALILAPIMLDVIGPEAELFGIRSTLIVIVIVIGLTSWATTARVIRSQVLSLKERMFVDRARVIGSGSGRIMRRHILPNVVNLIVAQSVLTFATAVFTETTLAFIGLGDPRSLVGPDPQQRAIRRGAWPRRVVVHRAARGRRGAGGPGVHAGRQRARRRAEPQGAEPPVSDTVEQAGPTEADPAAPVAADLAAIRRRRQWPLPKLAVPDSPLLVVEDLAVRFSLPSGSVKAVDGVSFRLDDGEALGIAGESGCGKTTTALSLVRLLPANGRIRSGKIELFGIDLVPKTETQLARYRWREISIVFQGAMNALNPVRRVGDQIAEPIEVRLGQPRDSSRKRAAELLDLVGIPKKRSNAYPHELSGGMRQRAMIAMALACDPAIVIGDEPTTALDVMVQAQILQLLEQLRRDLGLSLILITHDLSVIAETCDKVMVMYAGRIAEEGPVRRVFTAPRHPYTQALLSAYPNIHADRRTLEVIPGMPPDLRNPPPGCRFAPRCAFAMPVCTEVVPPEITFADGVRVACHLYPTADAPMAGEAAAGAAHEVIGHDAIPHEHPAPTASPAPAAGSRP